MKESLPPFYLSHRPRFILILMCMCLLLNIIYPGVSVSNMAFFYRCMYFNTMATVTYRYNGKPRLSNNYVQYR